MTHNKSPFQLLLVILLLATLSACGSISKKNDNTVAQTQATSTETNELARSDLASAEFDDEEYEETDIDPWENMNRAIFKFNTVLDKAILKPVAKGYVKVMPTPVRKGVSNFFSNLAEPTTIVNDVLQGKFKQGAQDTGRFLVNSTVGILGIFDVAKHISLEKHREDFGQTFGKWGAGTGPYIVLPLLGPSNVRDGIGLIPQYLYTDPIPQVSDNGARTGLIVGRVINLRADLLRLDKLLDQQIDPYVFVRDGFLQQRKKAVYDGNLPEVEDEFLDEEFLTE